MTNQKEFFLSRITDFQKQITRLRGKGRYVLMSRLVLFLSSVVVFALFIKTQPLLAWSTCAGVVVAFLILLKTETGALRQINYLKNLIQVNETEIELLEGRFENLDEGKEFTDKGHFFVSDLDIFGRRSLFQLLNRSSTQAGRTLLAQWLKNPLSGKNEIKLRQMAVRELSEKTEWRQQFSALGKEKVDKNAETDRIYAWLSEENYFSNAFYAIVSWLFPLLTLAAIALYFSGILSSGTPLCFIIIQLLISWLHAKKIGIIHDVLSRKSEAIVKYQALISLIETDKFESNSLQMLQAKLRRDEEDASQSIRKLKTLVNALDSRMNIVVAFVLNGVLLWDIQVVRHMESWRSKHKEDFLEWIDAIAGFDAFVSLAGYAGIHPDYTFPEIQPDDFLIDAQDIGHPMIEENRLVKNNYRIQGFSKTDLLTGANMAGKSTFLRTIGVNLCLAMIGAPVCARAFRFSPVRLFTSLRTNDSLQENESFFYAELRRLHLLIQSYEQGEPVFFLLDEILKGTNSKDQHLGAVALTKKILRLKGVGIVATHDVELSKLSDEFPGQVRNLCFEITIENDKLNFDYTLREGVCRTMNASFLMKKMGIID